MAANQTGLSTQFIRHAQAALPCGRDMAPFACNTQVWLPSRIEAEPFIAANICGLDIMCMHKLDHDKLKSID